MSEQPASVGQGSSGVQVRLEAGLQASDPAVSITLPQRGALRAGKKGESVTLGQPAKHSSVFISPAGAETERAGRPPSAASGH